MNRSWWECLKLWVCTKFGHARKIVYDCPGGGNPEICTRCNALLSTEYSRSKQKEKL